MVQGSSTRKIPSFHNSPLIKTGVESFYGHFYVLWIARWWLVRGLTFLDKFAVTLRSFIMCFRNVWNTCRKPVVYAKKYSTPELQEAWCRHRLSLTGKSVNFSMRLLVITRVDFMGWHIKIEQFWNTYLSVDAPPKMKQPALYLADLTGAWIAVWTLCLFLETNWSWCANFHF